VVVCAAAIELPTSSAVTTRVAVVSFRVMAVKPLLDRKSWLATYGHGASNPWRRDEVLTCEALRTNLKFR
jgi:hypothetical protein